jgi:hypothetical protein
MKFIEKVQEQFKKAGWKEGRNVSEKYKNGLRMTEFPLFVRNFLKEYGDLTILDCKPQKSEVINKLRIDIDYGGFEEEEDYQYYLNKLGKPVYPFALIEPDGYRIACDADGKVYMLGDYTFLIANSLKEGIEILVQDDWSKGYQQLDEKTGKWIKDKKWNE